MKNTLLAALAAFTLLIAGPICIRLAADAAATPEVVKEADLLSWELSTDQLDKIRGIVDEEVIPLDERVTTLEHKVEKLQTDLSDCALRCSTCPTKAQAAVDMTPPPVASVLKPSQPLPRSTFSETVVACPNGKCPTTSSPPVASTSTASTPNVTRSVVRTQSFSAPVAQPNIVRSSSSHWTYPGDITSHLETDHGQSVAGLSHEQQLDLHDSLHESGRTSGVTVSRSYVRTSAPIVSTPVYAPQFSTAVSSCPNGQCPTATSYTQTTRTRSGPLLRIFRR